jgi:hypothetical protein
MTKEVIYISNYFFLCCDSKIFLFLHLLWSLSAADVVSRQGRSPPSQNFPSKIMTSPARSSSYSSVSRAEGANDGEEIVISDSLGIAQQLSSRLAKDRLFTRIGGRCLVSVRPSRGSPMDVLSKDYAMQAKDANTKQPLPAHAFHIASSAYLHALRASTDQSIVLL